VSARRGRKAAHGPETLLDLVAEVARAAASASAALVPEQVSMPGFNRTKLGVDRARGIADPRTDPERTPTADAIQMRFKELAGRKVPWSELVEVALRAPEKRTMWLAALGREDARHDITDVLVVHALRRVAHELGGDGLGLHGYGKTRDRLVRQDRAVHGEDGVLDRLLPTANQVLAYCDMSWREALDLAGLRPRPSRGPSPASPGRAARTRPRLNPIPGMPPVQVIAFYRALNGHWPSKPTLLHFAGTCGIRMAEPKGAMAPLRVEADQPLSAAGHEPPKRTCGGGKGKRLAYRYPVDGIPGAPLRDPDARRGQLVTNPAVKALRRERALTSVRMWLASTSAQDKRTRHEYVRWQAGTGWTSHQISPGTGASRR
jgi:hypothetical protein